MKSIRYTITLTLIFALTSLAQLRAQSAKDLIAQKWNLSFEEMTKFMSDAEKAELDKMTDEQKAMMKGMLEKSYFHFKKNGTFEVSMPMEEVETMKWTISDDGKTLTTTEDGGKVTKITIVELTKKKLILRPEDGGGNGPKQMVFYIKD